MIATGRVGQSIVDAGRRAGIRDAEFGEVVLTGEARSRRPASVTESGALRIECSYRMTGGKTRASRLNPLSLGQRGQKP